MNYDPEKRKGAWVFRPNQRYQICSQCINDTLDPEIVFDDDGVCNHCHDYKRQLREYVFPPPIGNQKLGSIIARIKKEGRGKPYDCVLGLSGGVDSSYVAYLCKKFGLRPLAVHLDNGWNSEPAVRNIENIVETLDFDLYTRVLDWEEFRNLQLAFLRGSTPDSEIPTDHAIIATLYQMCEKHRVRWIMDGSNVVTEVMMAATWSHGHMDWGYIKGLNDQFSPTPLKTYPHYTYWDWVFKYRHVKKIRRFPILNFVEFDKKKAMEILKKELGWQPYGGKHYESIYTRFYQGYMLPAKFGWDKRRAHLSCLILDGQITREEALRDMQKPALDEEQAREDRAFVIKKLGVDEAEFERIMQAERKTFWDYPSDERDLPKTLKYRAAYGGLQSARAAAYMGLGVARGLVLVSIRRVQAIPKFIRNPREFIQGAKALPRRVAHRAFGLVRNPRRFVQSTKELPRRVARRAFGLVRIPRGFVQSTKELPRRVARRAFGRTAMIAVPVLKQVLPEDRYCAMRDYLKHKLGIEQEST